MPKRTPREPPEALEVTRAREEFARDKELDDLKNILVDPRVRDFLWRFMAWCGMFTEQFNPNFGVTGHNLGRAAAGKWLWEEISQADAGALLDMLRAHREAQIAAQNAVEEQRPADESPQ